MDFGNMYNKEKKRYLMASQKLFNIYNIQSPEKYVEYFAMLYFFYNKYIPDKLLDQYGEERVRDDVSDYFGYDVCWPIAGKHSVTLETGIKIWQLTQENFKILNCGSGVGSSVAYLSLHNNVDITTIEQIPLFTKLSQLCIEEIISFGLPLYGKIRYLDSKIIPFEKHILYHEYKDFAESDYVRSMCTTSKMKRPFLVYEDKFNRVFDMIVIDGPSCFRLSNFLLTLEYVKDGGVVVFEHCRNEVAVLKALGVPLLEFGSKIKKGFKIHGVKYKISYTSVLEVTEDIRSYFKRAPHPK